MNLSLDWYEQRQVRPEEVTHHGAICDEADKGVGWEQTKADDDGIPECFEIFFVETGVYDEEEDGWYLNWTGEGVLNGGVLWQEFSWQVCV